MSEQEVRGLCLKSREIFLQQPILLELEAPLSICGRSLLRSISCATILLVAVQLASSLLARSLTFDDLLIRVLYGLSLEMLAYAGE